MSARDGPFARACKQGMRRKLWIADAPKMTVRISSTAIRPSRSAARKRARSGDERVGDAAEMSAEAMPGKLSARDAIGRGGCGWHSDDAPRSPAARDRCGWRRLERYMRASISSSPTIGAHSTRQWRGAVGGPPPSITRTASTRTRRTPRPEAQLLSRLGFPAAHRLVVPSERLERIALREWRQPRERVERIANGIPVARYRAGPKDEVPGLVRAEARS